MWLPHAMLDSLDSGTKSPPPQTLAGQKQTNALAASLSIKPRRDSPHTDATNEDMKLL